MEFFKYIAQVLPFHQQLNKQSKFGSLSPVNILKFYIDYRNIESILI